MPDGVNRVILATDGDFNVGVTSHAELDAADRARSGRAACSSPSSGVGTGNLQDIEDGKLADHGDGNYAYLDSMTKRARFSCVRAARTLVTVAKDVKIQIEFNPQLGRGVPADRL